MFLNPFISFIFSPISEVITSFSTKRSMILSSSEGRPNLSEETIRAATSISDSIANSAVFSHALLFIKSL